MSTSKVTVEYHDESGVFPLISHEVAARLPLRNLNWQSPPRPLRQIKSLHLDFVPDRETQANLRPTSRQTHSERQQSSLDIATDGTRTGKERRHQIPGFRTSPYLHVYVLRCDDGDAYKEVERKKVREWVKQVAQPEGKQDHDAHEWLILHIVVPDTVAASEPRWRESSRDSDDLKERKSGSKLIGKSTRTVFDRLRADFNDAGKSGVDRVAQIRIVKKDAPADLLPTPAVAQTYEESPHERELAWSDLVSKLKSLILGPFDRRVRQYEADIAEQEARRSLPGWNFCTFFIHKEGLAIALESIGLVEDALAIYDELSLGLETVLREMATGEARGTATSFADFTDDLQSRISGPPDVNGRGDSGNKNDIKHDADLLFSKDYRESILRSSISVFDFMCYIFYRQKALILRLANAQHARLEQTTKEGGEDLVLTAEICWRASNFIHVGARALRQDQARGSGSSLDIEGVVCSWTWALAGQVLAETAVPALMDVVQHGSRRSSNGSVRRPSTSTGVGANTHPQRTSSLPDAQAAIDLSRPPSRHQSPGSAFQPATSNGIPQPGLPGQADLATYRADLLMMQRRLLEQLARIQGWLTGPALTRRASASHQAEQTAPCSPDHPSMALADHSLCPSLRKALMNEQAFGDMYQRLTESAIKHFNAATQLNSVERLLGDLAMLKCQQDDWLSATTYLDRVTSSESYAGWESLNFERLGVYAYCLKRLGRKQDFVRASLGLLSRLVRRQTGCEAALSIHTRLSVGTSSDGIDIGLREAVQAARELESEDVYPLKNFFGEVELHGTVTHDDQTDAVSLSLSITHFLNDRLELDQVKVRLINVDDPSQEVWLESAGTITFQPGQNTTQLWTKTNAYGPYLVDTIELKVSQLRFVEHLRATPEPTPLGITVVEPTTTIRDARKPPSFVLLYPREHAFSATVRRARHTHIDKPRHLELTLQSGQNAITSIDIKVKPATAGLRLHLGDARLQNIETNHETAGVGGHVLLGALAADRSAQVVIPYTTEQPCAEVAFRVELQYTTAHGTFTVVLPASVDNELPLDVDVNDIFQLDRLHSTFTVRATSQKPLAVLGAELHDSPLFAVEAPPATSLPLSAFDSRPVKFIYTITRKTLSEPKTLKRDAALAFELRYAAIDELFLTRLEQTFLLDIKQSSLSPYCRLLMPLLVARARQGITTSDIQLAALLGEMRVLSFEAVGWTELVATLPTAQRSVLEEWLRAWHDKNRMISLEDHEATEPHCITMSVDVPSVDMVFSTALDVSAVSETATGSSILTLGEPVNADVVVRHTSCWSAREVFPHVPTFKIDGESERKVFVVNVESADDTWLIGGQKRRHFVPENDMPCSFSVVLIPLRAGRQALPALQVQQEELNHEMDEMGIRPTSSTCECHYESAGTEVQVIRRAQHTTVHVPDAASVSLARPGNSRPGTSGTN